jgi:outer membrane receptor protein involved in Fe transport
MKTTANLLFTIIFLILIYPAYSQRPGRGADNFSVEGTVIDADLNKPMEYATVTLLRAADSSLVGGIATDIQGKFSVKAKQPGNYILKIGFIGFERINHDVTLTRENRQVDVGTINLWPRAENLEQVTVRANEHDIEYHIDKKVVHVSEQYTAISGNAVDILENVPSIQVDIEGNVSLRGNSNFTVLIDDRPTVLDANDALQQIPAAMIKDIEIITNPSAKYDPEGTAGIINIITKKRTLEGVSGIVHLDAGLDDKYGGDFLLNYRNEHYNVFVGADYSDRTYPGFIEEENRTYGPDTTFFLTSDGDRQRGGKRYSARAGFEWFPNDKNTLTISGRYGSRNYEGISETVFNEWNTYSSSRNRYISDETGSRGGDFYSLNSEYTRQFSSKKHKLDLQLMYYYRNGDENNLNSLLDDNNEIRNSQKSLEGGPGQGLRYRVNYMQPFSEAFNIEAGAQGRISDSEEWNEMYFYNTVSDDYILQPKFSHTSFYAQSTHAGYALAKGEFNNLGYQFGIRSEYTYRDISMKEADQSFNIDRWDFFPTLHFSYQLPDDHQLMASYTRRIDRPRGWFLEPFYTWSDAYNIRRGNPGLQPEYINSYELGYQKEFDRNSVSMEVYYRSTDDRIERIRSVYDENIMLHTFENVGTDYSLGTELMVNLTPIDWWETSLTGNFYDYRVKGQLNEVSFDKHSFTWSLRWSQIFNITENTRLQLNPSYHSPEVEAQEKEEGFFYIHGAVRQSFMNNKFNLTLQVRDMFGTGKHESVIDGRNFYNYRLYEHKAPIVMLNFTWRINNYRNGDRRDRGGGGDMEMEGEGM